MVPRVLILFHNQLFGQAVRAILEQAGAIQLAGIQPSDQVTAEGISSLMPNVIIAEWGRTGLNGGCATEMVKFVLAGGVSKVKGIFFNLENGQAWVCDNRHLQDIGKDELLEIILDSTSPIVNE